MRFISSSSKKLTITLLDKIDFSKVIYGERSQSGAMGNSGGIILYVLTNDKLIRYDTSSFEDAKTTLHALKLVGKNENNFNTFYGGFGNGVFINKASKFELNSKKQHFIFKEKDREYIVNSSVPGVFIRVSKILNDEQKNNIDPIHLGWEAQFRI